MVLIDVSTSRPKSTSCGNAGRRPLWLLLSPLLLCILPGAGPAALAAPTSAKEYELKAAYIYNFAKFTRWPNAGESGVPSPLVIGVVGDERVADSLAELTKGRTSRRAAASR